MNEFNRAFNLGNAAFAASCSESFTVEPTAGTKQNGIPGSYVANSIDDLTAGQAGAPGGKIDVNQVHVFLDKDVLAMSQIVEGTVLRVRGKKVRVVSFSDAGDNKVTVVCNKTSLIANTTG